MNRPDASDIQAASSPRDRLLETFAVAAGMAMTLIVVGYSFGESNHHVYLLEALRMHEPALFSRDWFTVGTLQYHVLFSRLTATLFGLGVLETGFFVGQIVTILVFHTAWLGLVKRFGGSIFTYLLSLILFYASAGGLGLGMYRFMQDGSFLPSNVAAVLTLAGIYFWVGNRLILSAISIAVAGLFHLNYACVGILAWTIFAALDAWRDREIQKLFERKSLIAAAIVVVGCGMNIAVAARSKWQHNAAIPLEDFIEIYVMLRHPHHYDMTSWPTIIWVAFLWPIVPAAWAFRTADRTPARKKLGHAMLFALALQAVAFVGAGFFYFNETLIQLSFWRFSIFAKLIACIAVAWLIIDRWKLRPAYVGVALLAVPILATLPLLMSIDRTIDEFASEHATTFAAGAGSTLLLAVFFIVARTKFARIVAAAALLQLPIVAGLALQGKLGTDVLADKDPSLAALARWCRDNTPVDSLFVVPPADSSFRLESRRSALVSYKQVPQLSGELKRWKNLLDEVLGVDVRALPRPMFRTLAEMNEIYAQLPDDHLAAVARRHDADYFIAMRDLGPDFAPFEVRRSDDGRFILYRTPGVNRHPPDSP